MNKPMLALRLPDRSKDITIVGVGKGEYQTLGTSRIIMHIHGVSMMPSTVHVVDDNCVDFPILMGSDFLARNHLNINIKKRKLICTDSTNGAKWVLYLEKPDDRCHFIHYKVPCVAVEDVKLKANIPVEVPIRWEFPNHQDTMYECSQCATDQVLFYYDGEVLY